MSRQFCTNATFSHEDKFLQKSYFCEIFQHLSFLFSRSIPSESKSPTPGTWGGAGGTPAVSTWWGSPFPYKPFSEFLGLINFEQNMQSLKRSVLESSVLKGMCKVQNLLFYLHRIGALYFNLPGDPIPYTYRLQCFIHLRRDYLKQTIVNFI